MDFMNRAQQSRPVASNANVAHDHEGGHKHVQQADGGGKWLRVATVSLTALITVIILALIVNFAFANNPDQTKYLNKDDYQAVFVNVNGSTGGQVYFGHIQAVNNQFIDLTNVFYIQNQGSGTSSSSAYTLVKLGCELHAPTDMMVINSNQVYFWENLKPSGQVAQKIAQWYQQNPNGQKCTQAAGTGTTQSSTNTQSSTSGSSGATTTPTTTTNSTKKP